MRSRTSASRSRGGGRCRTKLWIPATEHTRQIAIQDFGTCLQQQVRPLERPLHLLALYKVFAHDLVDRRFHKGRANGVPLAIAFAEVGDKLTVVANVCIKLGHAAVQFRGGWETATLCIKVKQQEPQT